MRHGGRPRRGRGRHPPRHRRRRALGPPAGRAGDRVAHRRPVELGSLPGGHRPEAAGGLRHRCRARAVGGRHLCGAGRPYRAARAAHRLLGRRQHRHQGSARHARPPARRRPQRHHRRHGRRPQPDAGGRAQPSRSRRRGGRALCQRAGDARPTTRPRSASPASTWAAAPPASSVVSDGQIVHADAVADRRPPRHHGSRARPVTPHRRCRAAEDAVRQRGGGRRRRPRDRSPCRCWARTTAPIATR